MRAKRRLPWRRIIVAAVAALVLVVLAGPARDAWTAYRFVSGLEAGADETDGADAGAAAREDANGLRFRIGGVVEGPAGRGFLYAPTKLPAPGVVLVHGASLDGPRDPRLKTVARALARAGFAVYTPELREVCDLTVSPSSVEAVVAAFEDLSSRKGLVDPARVGLVGVSLSTGPVLVAAGDPRIAARVRFAVSFGGYGDLRRLASPAALEGGAGGGGNGGSDHVFARQLAALRFADRLVPAAELAALRQRLIAIVQEERDPALETGLGQEARRLLDYAAGAADPDLARRLGALLAADEPALAAVSPEARPGSIRCPVFLVHGAGDPLIPADESRSLAAALGSRTDVDLLITPLYGHAERALVSSSIAQKIELARLFAFVFRLVRAS